MSSSLVAAIAKWKYVLELFRLSEDEARQGEQVAVARVKSDFDPLVEAARFECLRRHLKARCEIGAEAAHVEPVWHEDLGEPYVEAILARVVGEEGETAECRAATSFFRPHAELAASQVIAEGLLAENESFRYLVTAYREPAEAPPPTALFAIETIAQSLSLESHRQSDYELRSRPMGPTGEGEAAVFVHEFILDEIRELMTRAGAVETGGVLIGHLHRDDERSDVFLEIAAQIPARFTQQELTSLTFTPETWSDVDAAVALRGRDEIHLGWWHSHPAREWCKNCPAENRAVCKRSGEFFSSDDAALHRTVFPRAYSVGLVVSDSYAAGLTFPMFGWKNGQIATRGFHVLRER